MTMKKYISITLMLVLCLTLVLSLAACGGGGAQPPPRTVLQVAQDYDSRLAEMEESLDLADLAEISIMVLGLTKDVFSNRGWNFFIPLGGEPLSTKEMELGGWPIRVRLLTNSDFNISKVEYAYYLDAGVNLDVLLSIVTDCDTVYGQVARIYTNLPYIEQDTKDLITDSKEGGAAIMLYKDAAAERGDAIIEMTWVYEDDEGSEVMVDLHSLHMVEGPAKGTTIKLSYWSWSSIRDSGSSGSSSGSATKCTHCNGTGWNDPSNSKTAHEWLQTRVPCTRCDGTGIAK